jgi:N-acetyl-alpha-D-muramate 1-phosphate uridylyltransferase
MSTLGSRAFVLAAGLGQRMRPLTNTRPKPLIEVHGRSLIDYGFDRLREAKCDLAVVNVHYLAGQIEAWAKQQKTPRIIISDEREELLDTGGGIAKALPLLEDEPFFVLNSDSFWIDGVVPALQRLKERWVDAEMDCLLLLCPVERTVGYDGQGDFIMSPDGKLTRRADANGKALAYIGGYLVHPRLFHGSPSGKFSMNVIWNRAIVRGRLYGLEHEGIWLHVGTPGALALAEAALRR